MKTTLIILNYQREIPPFLQNEIMFAKETFDEVIYISRKLVKDNRNTITFQNVKIVEIPRWRRTLAFLTSPFKILSRLNFSILKNLFKNKKLNRTQLKNLVTQIFVSTQLYATTKSIIKEKEDTRFIILSAWFDSVALAAARLAKEGHHAISFAHSYEIDPTRTPFFDYSFKNFKHQYLYHTYFISEVMMNKYNDITKGIHKKNISTRHLGSIKRFSSTPPNSSNNNFTIVSCSSLVKIKRIHLIIEALKNWTEGPILWRHLGGGPEYQILRAKIEEVKSLNKNIKIYFDGEQISNEKVQSIYASTPINLFLNVSENEGLPVSIMEALSYGIPCVATNVGGSSELINESNGILLNRDFEIHELLNAILFFYKLSQNEYMFYRANALKLWKEKFNAANNARNFYKSLKQQPKNEHAR